MMAPTGSTVYPRVCGGTGDSIKPEGFYDGLSPRVRGNRVGVDEPWCADGSIPACAGEPCSNRAHAGRSRVYPRVCGGTVLVFRPDVRKSGLSPRVRGNRPASLSPICLIGSIPACAGEPRTSTLAVWPLRVYPRVCGGTAGHQLVDGAQTGLSPRVRGNRYHANGIPRRRRSIPACAGEPAFSRMPSTNGRVYPRVCGGTHAARRRRGHQLGLSPRVRGNQEPGLDLLVDDGSIPACAGEPE